MKKFGFFRFKSPQGFSLVEVMVGAAILLVSALAVAYLMKGGQVPRLDSLKACQDINEEVLSAINSLGQDSFAYTYGTGTNQGYTDRHCPSGICTEGELGIPAHQRWNSTRTRLTTANLRPTVRPHYLKLSSMTYLEALYNTNPSYCGEHGAPIPGGTFGASSSTFDFFKTSGDSNLLGDRGRFGNTMMRIQLVNETGATSCTSPFHIRPQAHGHGDSSPILDAGIIDPLRAARVRVGFKVDVMTRYQDAGDGRGAGSKICTTTKNFFYQPESYRGQIATEWLVEPFSPSFANNVVILPQCGSDDPVVATSRFRKAKKDSVFLCRERSEVGTWANPAKCDPFAPSGNPMLPNCSCAEVDGCMNEWARFGGLPPWNEVIPTFTAPNNQWFACDQLPSRLVLSGMVTDANHVRVNFEPDIGHGAMNIVITDINRDLPRRIRVDVIEVDSALNSSADIPAAVPGDEFAKLSIDYFGVHPGEQCEICGTNPIAYKFDCACEPCCDRSTECCDGDTNLTNPNCGPCEGLTGQALTCCQTPLDPSCCDSATACCEGDTHPTNPRCPDCDDWASAGYSSRVCCETGNADPSCSSCDDCTDSTCPGYNPNRCACPAYAAANPGTCAEPCVSSPPFSGGTCCSDGADATRTYCAGPGGLEWWRERVVCRFPSATATEGSWTVENMPFKSNCSPGSCSPGQTPVCSDSGGCSCI